MRALHTPGHSPGSTRMTSVSCSAATPCSPAAGRDRISDFSTILQSISERLGKLPGETVVHTGHGDSTTTGDEIVHYEEWVARGH